MIRRLLLVAFCTVGIPTAALAWDAAKIRQARKDLDEAKGRLKDAKSELDGAHTRLQTTTNEKTSAVAEVKRLRDTALAQFEAMPAFGAALADQTAAQADFDLVAGPCLKAFRESPEFKRAVEAADLARARLRTLGASVAQNGAELTTVNHAMQAPVKLEQAALEQDPAAGAAKAKLYTAQSKVAELREQAREQIEKDPQLQQANKALAAASREWDQARVQLKVRQQQVAKYQSNVSGRLAAVAAAVREDERENNKK